MSPHTPHLRSGYDSMRVASFLISENSWSFSAIRVQKEKFYGGKEYEEECFADIHGVCPYN